MPQDQPRKPNWSKKELAILRKHPAADVARLTGRTLSAIYTRRKMEGVPDGHRLQPRTSHRRYWTPAEDRLVRTLSVDEAVRRTGRTRFNLLARRRQLGMPPLPKIRPGRVPLPVPPLRKTAVRKRAANGKMWTAAEDELLRTLPTVEATKLLKRTAVAMANRRFFLRHQAIGEQSPGRKRKRPLNSRDR